MVGGERRAPRASSARPGLPASGRGGHRSGRRTGAGRSRAPTSMRGERLGDVVQAAEAAQVGVVQRLHAERDAVDAGGAVAAEALRLDAGRVGLERDLDVGGDGPVLRRSRRGSRRPSPAAISDGVPPPRKMLVDRRARAGRAAACAISARRRAAKRVLVDRLVADMAVEVAIGALGRAERPVDVDAEARGSALARSSAAQPRARRTSRRRGRGATAGRGCPASSRASPRPLISPKVRVVAVRQEHRIVAEAVRRRAAARRACRRRSPRKSRSCAVGPGEAQHATKWRRALLGRRTAPLACELLLDAAPWRESRSRRSGPAQRAE